MCKPRAFVGVAERGRPLVLKVGLSSRGTSRHAVTATSQNMAGNACLYVILTGHQSAWLPGLLRAPSSVEQISGPHCGPEEEPTADLTPMFGWMN